MKLTFVLFLITYHIFSKLILIIKPKKRKVDKWSLYGNAFLLIESTKLSHKLWSVVLTQNKSYYLLLSTKKVFSCLIENLSKTKVPNDIEMNFIKKELKEKFKKGIRSDNLLILKKRHGKVASIFHFMYLRTLKADTLKFWLPKIKLQRPLTLSSSRALR